jgi:hypothetical protein
VPRGLGLALGLIVLLMALAFGAVKLRDCREEQTGVGGPN